MRAADASAELARAGVKPLQAACGNDGRVYPSTCGAPDGRIVIVTVAASDVERARSVGFAPLSQLPEAVKTPCS